MFKIATITLALLFVCHFCLAADSSNSELGEQQEEVSELIIQAEEDFASDDANYGNVPHRKLRVLTVDAAMSVNTEGSILLYLFIDKEVHVLRDRQIVEIQPRDNFFLPDSMNLQGAFVTLESQDNRIFYGDKYGQFISADGSNNRRLKYGPAREFIRDGGPDAAGRLNGKVYVFKGCKVAVRNDWNDWEDPVSLSTLNLPCDVHAAWKENDKMVILKGDLIWHWNADDTVSGPELFGSTYTLRPSDALKPVKEEKSSNQEATDYGDFYQDTPQGPPRPQPPQELPRPQPSQGLPRPQSSQGLPRPQPPQGLPPHPQPPKGLPRPQPSQRLQRPQPPQGLLRPQRPGGRPRPRPRQGFLRPQLPELFPAGPPLENFGDLHLMDWILTPFSQANWFGRQGRPTEAEQ